MVTCRCGCVFENPREASHVMCPQCKGSYANTAPNLFHPIAEAEKRWQCARCGALNDASCAGAPRRVCSHCQAARPGDPDSWY